MVTESPQFYVKEGTTTTFKCSSDEGNPPPLIKFNYGNRVEERITSGRFSAKITESTSGIIVNRTMNQKEICCFIEPDETKGQKKLEQKVTMSVKCESYLSPWVKSYTPVPPQD